MHINIANIIVLCEAQCDGALNGEATQHLTNISSLLYPHQRQGTELAYEVTLPLVLHTEWRAD